VFGALVHSVQEMCVTDRSCTLLLDEVPIKQYVCFNQKLDCVEGLKTGPAMLQITLVFTIHGLHRKWKQPVVCYISSGSTITDIIVLVFVACQNAVLTVCCWRHSL
jgi:hypothetical protein